MIGGALLIGPIGTAGAMTASALTALRESAPVLVSDFSDGLGDTVDMDGNPVAKLPELTRATMTIYADDMATPIDESATAVFVATTNAPTLSEDWAVVWLDTTGDLVDDVRVITPDVYMDQDREYSVKVEKWTGSVWAEVDVWGVWVRRADSYRLTFDWRAAGLTSARFAFGLTDEPADKWDFAPNDYSGALLALPWKPSVPQSVAVVPGDGVATVSWAAPSSLGVPTLTGYTVVASPGGSSCTTAGLSCVVPGLANQTGYTFSVVAVNRVGSSPAAVTGSIVPQPFVVIRLKAKKAASVMYVDVDPNLPKKGYWTFRVEKLAADGVTWVTMPKSYRTSGSKETRTLNFKKGTYRVVVMGKNGYQQTTSNSTVVLKK